MMNCCCCESQQEAWIREAAEGKPNRFRKDNPRVIDMLESFDCTPPYVDIERARYFTESMKQTEGQHLTLRWAKALMNVAQKMPVYIEDTQLIVGRLGTDKGRYGIVYPELDGDFYEGVLADFATRENPPIRIDKENIPVLLGEIGSYWKGKTYHHALFQNMPEFCRHNAYSDAEGLSPRYIVSESSSLRSSLQWVLDFDKVLKLGFAGVKADAMRRLEALDPENPADQLYKRPFLEAVALVCDAVVVFAHRHAALAREKAVAEKDPVRKQELLEIAERCEWVPEHPARTFHEAVQSHWFAQAFSRLEQRTGCIISNGRMDQQLISYYRQDIKAGILDEKKALEILGCMWCQMAQFIELPLSPGVMDTQAGFAHWEAVTIGGQTTEGLDATNELTYLLLKSKREFPTHYPDLAVRVHARTPQRLLWDVAETIKQGQGYPKLLNDEELIPRMLAKGAPASEVFDYVVSGCNETRLINRESYMSPGTQVNLGAALELVLRNGRLKKFGDELFTFETGDPCSFKTWEEFWDAYVKQQNNLIKSSFMLQDTIHHTRAKFFASPLASGLHSLCMDSCVDLNSDVAPEGALDIAFFDAIGFGTVVDSLSAIKKLVFEDKKLTMDEVIKAIDANFEGYEDVKALLKSAPCYGNNDPYADSIGHEIDRLSVEFAAKYSQKDLGMHYNVRYVPFTSHVPFGKVVSATPNGRVDWFPLSDGSSASHGADVNGPTAVLLSNYNTKNMGMRDRFARMLNIKFTPKCVEGEQGTEKLVSFIRTFCDLKLWHVQFNVVNKSTLLAAQKDPQKYRNLIVRIAGYSAYFVDLSPDLQNDLIARTEHDTI